MIDHLNAVYLREQRRRENVALAKLWGCAVLALVLALIVGCSPSERQKTLSTAYASVNAAAVAFVAYDDAHQAALVAEYNNPTDRMAALDGYRKKQAKVLAALLASFRAIAAALLVNDNPSLQTALAAVAIVAQELHDLGVKVPAP